MTEPDPRMVNAALRALYPVEHRAAEFQVDEDPEYPEDFAEFIAGVRPNVTRALVAALAADPLRQGDTIPIDRDLIKPLRDICRELGYLGLLHRLPNSDQEPQP